MASLAEIEEKRARASKEIGGAPTGRNEPLLTQASFPARMRERNRHPLAWYVAAAVFLGLLIVFQYAVPTPEPLYDGSHWRALLTDLAQEDDNVAAPALKTLGVAFRRDRARWVFYVNECLNVCLHGLHVHVPLRSDRERFEAAFADGMIPLLSDRDATVRGGAARALSFCPDEGDRIVPTLIPHLDDPDPQCRRWVALTLRHLPTPREITLNDLILALESKERNTASYACLALSRLGSRATAAIPVLQRLIKHGDSTLIREREEALRAIDPAALSPADHPGKD